MAKETGIPLVMHFGHGTYLNYYPEVSVTLS